MSSPRPNSLRGLSWAAAPRLLGTTTVSACSRVSASRPFPFRRLSKFLLRQDRRWEGATNWTQGHLQWIRQQKFDQEPQNMVLRDYLAAVERAKERVDRLTQAIEEAVPDWHLAEVVKNLQALRGVRLLTAAVITAEVGNFLRFPSASKFMAYIGVVPTESSSADTRRSRSPLQTCRLRWPFACRG